MRLLRLLSDLLRVSFFTVLIFAFDKPYLAVMTVLALLWHEGFHLLAFLRERSAARPEARLCGLRLVPKRMLSYAAEGRIAAAGPLGGFIGAALCLMLAPLARGYLLAFALCHLFTSLSNLLPIEGYDGYRILSSLAAARGSERGQTALRALSFFFVGFLSLLSLCVLGICGEGVFGAGVFLFTLFFSIPEQKYTIFENS